MLVEFVEIGHIDSDDEGSVLAKMHGEFIHENGKHCEIYLSDPPRT